MVKDPICGMMVDEKTTKFKSDFNGKTFFFCAASCKATFDKSPEKFAKGSTGDKSKSCGCGCGGH